jgi:hypothetical protein
VPAEHEPDACVDPSVSPGCSPNRDDRGPRRCGGRGDFTTPSGNLTGGQTHTGRLDRTLTPASICGATDPFPGVIEDPAQFRTAAVQLRVTRRWRGG